MDRVPLREAALGRWRGILPMFGLDAKALSGKHGPCPMCGGTDRFRFDDKQGRGTWICSSCGAGDGVALVMAKTGLDFREAALRIEEQLGSVPRVEPKPERSDRSKRDAMNAFWRSTGPVTAGDPVALYLGRRVGLQAYPQCIRTAQWARYPDEPHGHHPCMVAMVVDVQGRPAQLHRTFLTKDGQKADVPKPRWLMHAELPPGSAIRLFDPEPKMGVAEGIETALSAASLFGIPVWALLNAQNLAKWVPPDGVRDVVIFGDNDVKFAGHAYGWMLAHRLACLEFSASMKMPERPGQDWNDVLCGGRHAA